MRISGPAPTHMISVLRYRNPARAVAWLCAAFGFNVHHVVKASNDDMMCASSLWATACSSSAASAMRALMP